MAEENSDRSREDLTEEASPFRLEEMRKQGRVAQSRELSGLIALLAAGSTLYLMSSQAGEDIRQFMTSIFGKKRQTVFSCK